MPCRQIYASSVKKYTSVPKACDLKIAGYAHQAVYTRIVNSKKRSEFPNTTAAHRPVCRNGVGKFVFFPRKKPTFFSAQGPIFPVLI